jgi:hypothetical protein
MLYWSDHSLLVAMQSAFGTPNIADGDAIKCELPSISFETEVVELDLLTGQPGAEPERMPGARGGTISFTIPLEGFKDGYTVSGNAPAADPGATGVIPLWLSLLANAMGSNLSAVSTDANFKDGLMCSVSQYTSGGVTSATSTAITLDDATASDKIDVGQLVCTATSASSTSLQLGFCKTKAAQVCTLFEASGTTVNSASANVYGTATAYASAEYVNQKPLTLQWTGPDAKFCYVLQDCITESVRITWEAQAVPTAEFTMRFYNYSMNKTLGGLVAPDPFNRVPQIVGNNNGRATINGVVHCGLESCTWEWTATFTPVKCHSSSQGTSAVLISKPRIRASFSVLHTDGDEVYDAAGVAGNIGSHVWQSYLEQQETISIATYVGTVVGRVWAQLIPAGRIIEVPAVEFRGENSVAYTIQVGAGAYTGDQTDKTETAADSPLNSISRQSLA